MSYEATEKIGVEIESLSIKAENIREVIAAISNVTELNDNILGISRAQTQSVEGTRRDFEAFTSQFLEWMIEINKKNKELVDLSEHSKD